MAVLELLPDRFPGDFVTPFPGLRPATLLDIWLLCKDLRPDDIEHYMAMSFDNQWDFERAAVAFHARPGFKFCLEAEDGRPLAVAGWAEQAPGTFDGWMVSTPETWTDAGKRLTRACRWGVRYMFEVVGARRLHDLGKSGWFLLLNLLPIIGWFLLLYWFVQPSGESNQFGEPAQA